MIDQLKICFDGNIPLRLHFLYGCPSCNTSSALYSIEIG